MTKVIFSHPELPKITIVIYSILKGMEMMLLSFPLVWSSMFTIGGTSKDSVIAF